MRLARLILLLVCVAATASACGDSAAPPTTAGAPPCARTFVTAITRADATPGVWDCLTESYHSRLQGEGDGVFAVKTPLWTRYHYLGVDHNIAMFDLTVNANVEPAVYDPPVMNVIMAVYLDAHGRVDHAKAATPS